MIEARSLSVFLTLPLLTQEANPVTQPKSELDSFKYNQLLTTKEKWHGYCFMMSKPFRASVKQLSIKRKESK